MSEWILPKVEDIDLDLNGKHVHIWIESDDSGNRYISVEGKALEHLKKLLTDSK